MAGNEFDGIEQRLDEVERLLATTAAGPDVDLVVLDRAELARLPAAVETYRAALALVGGDLPATVRHAELALARATAGDHLTTAAASALLGLAAWTGGHLDAAHRAYRAAAQDLDRAGHVADVLGCTIAITDIELTRGRLGDARRTFEHALDLAAPSAGVLRGVADMHVGLSRVAMARADPAAAADHLRRADELGEPASLPQNPYRWRVAMAYLREAEGDRATAVGLLEDAERVYVGDFSPDVQPVAATRARMLAAAGDLAGALAWARRAGVSAADELRYLREYEHVTLARVLLADHAASGSPTSLAQATTLLDRLLTAAGDGGRQGTVLEVSVLQALVHAASGDREPAMTSLERAVRLAGPEGYVSVFTAEGAPMMELLGALARRRRGGAFVRQLLAVPKASGTSTGTATGAATGWVTGTAADGSRAGAPREPVLVDPLSNRELEVLRLLGSDLDGPAIARELGVSLTTVRTHTQHVYTKLGVTNRRAAVRRAHGLNLFSRPGHA
jgi:LuxR family maltose regulon positive regulatory protein